MRPSEPAPTLLSLNQPSSLSEAALQASRASRSHGTHQLNDASKRLLDIVFAVLLLVLSLPVLVLACLAILITTGDAPILLQRRVGLHGREFTMLKLRSMRRSEPAPTFASADDAFVAKPADDLRVTPVGRFLRRTSLDELPQLLNVLAGQMSLVGPRPALPAEAARHPSSWLPRLRVRPGLTGLWQVSGRSNVPARRRIALDRYYIRHRSLRFDCLILIRTVATVLSRHGAW